MRSHQRRIGRILTKSRFRPVRILSTLDGGAEYCLGSAGICIWLLGVRECASTTNDLVRRLVAANSSVRPVILAEFTPQKTSCPRWRQAPVASSAKNIPSKQLIKSLELVALGQTVIHPHFHLAAFAQMAVQSHPIREFEATSATPGSNGYKAIAELALALRNAIPCWPRGFARGRDARNFEWGPGWRRRQRPVAPRVSDLRTLTEGASNKVIALKLVITELTVKVHMKAILRKLRLDNCTQAAIWARTYLGELLENQVA